MQTCVTRGLVLFFVWVFGDTSVADEILPAFFVA